MKEFENVIFENCTVEKVKSFKVSRTEENFNQPIIFRNCIFNDDVIVEIEINSNNPVEINNVTMGKKSELLIKVKTECKIDGLDMRDNSKFNTGVSNIDKLYLNNLNIGKNSNLKLTPKDKNIPEVSFTNCMREIGSTWRIVDGFIKLNRCIDGYVESPYANPGFRII